MNRISDALELESDVHLLRARQDPYVADSIDVDVLGVWEFGVECVGDVSFGWINDLERRKG